jgi:hypothetical protein
MHYYYRYYFFTMADNSHRQFPSNKKVEGITELGFGIDVVPRRRSTIRNHTYSNPTEDSKSGVSGVF